MITFNSTDNVTISMDRFQKLIDKPGALTRNDYEKHGVELNDDNTLTISKKALEVLENSKQSTDKNFTFETIVNLKKPLEAIYDFLENTKDSTQKNLGGLSMVKLVRSYFPSEQSKKTATNKSYSSKLLDTFYSNKTITLAATSLVALGVYHLYVVSDYEKTISNLSSEYEGLKQAYDEVVHLLGHTCMSVLGQLTEAQDEKVSFGCSQGAFNKLSNFPPKG